MLVEIQVLPQPAGTAQARYAHVDAAIAVIQRSGLPHEVHALGTVVEGPPERLWPLLRDVHEATLAAGAAETVTVVKVHQTSGEAGPGMADLVAPFRTQVDRSRQD